MAPLGMCIVLLMSVMPGAAAVVDVTVADVTTRAFSVVWVSDEPVTGATVRVFSDADGTADITSELTVTLVSSSFPPALDLGIVKVSVVGLSADTSVFVQTETTGASGTVLFPAAAPFMEVRTAVRTTKANAGDMPIVNDLIMHDVFIPGGADAAGTLLVLDVPGLAQTPLTAFVGEGFPLPSAAIDLNNLFDTATGESAEVVGGETLTLTEFRGLLCDLQDHKLARLRRAPVHEESPPITELEQPATCFSPNGITADFDCDGRVGLVDFTRFLGKFGSEAQDCKFNPDFDLDPVPDQRVGLVDFTRFLSVFGRTE